MYVSHFGFHRQPFHSADACRSFFVSESIRTILPQLFHALRSDLGIAVLTGMPGSGKTSLLRHIQQQIANEGRAIVCSGAGLGTSAELNSVLLQASRRRAGNEDADRSIAAVTSTQESRAGILDQVRRTAELWGPVLLLIDDAQLMPLSVLNELRACTEEEWNGRGLIRCLVSAPISFEEQLARSEYAEFGRRIRCHAFLQPLKSGESIRFLKEQIELVGGRLSQIFTNSALEFISMAAAGVPRCLSLLADESLVVAMESGEQTTTEHSVRAALGRLQHLQYNWNASPDADSGEESAAETHPSPESVSSGSITEDRNFDSSTEESSGPIPSTMTTNGTQKPTRATLAPGVIEFGGPATNVPPIVRSPSTHDAVSSTDGIALDVECDTKISSEASVVEVSAVLNSDAEPAELTNGGTQESAALEFGVSENTRDDFRTANIETPIKTAASFEVGRRFFAESSADSISVENIEDCEIVELLSLDSQPELDDYLCPVDCVTDCVDSVSTDGNTDRMEMLWIDGNADDSSCESSTTSDTESVIIPKTSTFGLDNIQTSDRTPVFDRYTWIELGRDVSSGVSSAATSTVRKQLMAAEYAVSATDPLEYHLASTARAARAGFTENIPISQTTDSDLMDQIRRNSLSFNAGPNVSPAQEQDADCDTSEIPGLKIWHDGQLIFSESSDSPSTDDPELMTSQSSASQFPSLPANTVPIEPGGFFTLPVPIDNVDVDLRSLEITEDKDVFRIVETLTSLRADIRQFQRTGEISGSNLNSGETSDGDCQVVASVEPASESDSLVSKARRRLDDRTTPGDLGVVALQITADARAQRTATAAAESASKADIASSSTPQFSRLFTRLWENRRRESGPAECDR